MISNYLISVAVEEHSNIVQYIHSRNYQNPNFATYRFQYFHENRLVYQIKIDKEDMTALRLKFNLPRVQLLGENESA